MFDSRLDYSRNDLQGWGPQYRNDIFRTQTSNAVCAQQTLDCTEAQQTLDCSEAQALRNAEGRRQFDQNP